jgi:hypothetical protein
MNAVSPRFASSTGWLAFADGSPTFSSDGMPTLRMRHFNGIEQASNRIAQLTLGNSRVPTQHAAELATEWLYASCERASRLGGWRLPHITSTEAGEIVFEWWRGARNLTLYFSDEGAEYIKVWGPDIDDEMISGPLNNWSFSNAWLWLQS